MKKHAYLILGVVILLLSCALCVELLLYLKLDPTSEAEQEARETVAAAYQAPQKAEPQPEPLERLPEEPAEEAPEEAPKEPYVSPIDFTSLQAVNPEIYAWLYIPNSDISYPLVQHDGDDTFYLSHNSNGDYDSEGAIFTEQTYSSKDFSEPVTVVYGHRLKSGTMFSQLQLIYSDLEGMADCSEIVVYLPEHELHYTVFAAVPYDNRHILYTYNFNSSRMYGAFLASVFSAREIGAVFQEKAAVSTDDKLLVLSTCLYGNAQKRYLVLAKCVEDITCIQTIMDGKDD